MADHKLVKVLWLDAQDHPKTWVDADDIPSFNDAECLIVSVGFLVRKTEKYLTIAGDWDESDNNYGTVRKIAIGMVKSVEDM